MIKSHYATQEENKLNHCAAHGIFSLGFVISQLLLHEPVQLTQSRYASASLDLGRGEWWGHYVVDKVLPQRKVGLRLLSLITSAAVAYLREDSFQDNVLFKHAYNEQKIAQVYTPLHKHLDFTVPRLASRSCSMCYHRHGTGVGGCFVFVCLFRGAKKQIQAFTHVRQMLYHRVPPSAPDSLILPTVNKDSLLEELSTAATAMSPCGCDL